MTYPPLDRLDRSAPLFLAGHRGLVGSAIARQAQAAGFTSILTRSRTELDLRDAAAVDRFFEAETPRTVILAAGTVGGIWANSTRPVEFLADNALIAIHVMAAAHRHGVERLLYLGSSCIYPRDAAQPIREEALLTGPLEPTNEPYALAKIAGLRLADAYRRQYGRLYFGVMPSNLYGPGDNFDPVGGHVLPALMRRFHEARETGQMTVTVWGSGRPRREFLYVEDLAEACLLLLDQPPDEPFVNVGTGEDVTIRELAESLRDLIHPEAEIVWDTSKPDGTPRKLLDVSRMADRGWRAKTRLADGLARTYDWYIRHGSDRTGALMTKV